MYRLVDFILCKNRNLINHCNQWLRSFGNRGNHRQCYTEYGVHNISIKSINPQKSISYFYLNIIIAKISGGYGSIYTADGYVERKISYFPPPSVTRRYRNLDKSKETIKNWPNGYAKGTEKANLVKQSSELSRFCLHRKCFSWLLTAVL